MSTRWGLVCLAHDQESPIDMNHGADLLRQLVARADEVAAAVRLADDLNGNLEVYGVPWGVLRFASEHRDCAGAVALLNEYGATEPLDPDQPTRCQAGAAVVVSGLPRHVTCQLPHDHYGSYHWWDGRREPERDAPDMQLRWNAQHRTEGV